MYLIYLLCTHCYFQLRTFSPYLFTDVLAERIENINAYFTFSLYSNVCRSLFERHKLLFSFLLCVRILMNENKINMVSCEGVAHKLHRLISNYNNTLNPAKCMRLQHSRANPHTQWPISLGVCVVGKVIS